MLFSQIFVRRPVMATAINLVLLIIGIVAYFQLELRHTPNAPKGEVEIQTIYAGANNFALENQVTKPLEDSLAGLNGIRKLSSVTQDGMSSIWVKFKPGVDPEKALSQVRDRVLATMSSLPEAIKRPEIRDMSEEDPTIAYLMFEDDTITAAKITDYLRRTVEDRLRLIDGVASVGHFGNQSYMVAITVDPARLMQYNITVKEVVDALKQERNYVSGGEVEGVTSKESVVLTAMAEKPKDFEDVTVKMTPKGRITIKNVANVVVSEKPVFTWMRVNGFKRVALSVAAKPQANPLEVAKRVHRFVDDLKKTMPSTMKATVIVDKTEGFAASFTEIRHTLWEAIILVGIIMTLSLASFRAALLPIITVPLCLIGTFALMWMMGFSINPISLLALVLAVGLVVDDAIVVVENVYRHMEEGQTALTAAINGMREITFAVVVMTITLAAVYLPLIFQADDSSAIFREFAWTLAGSVLISGFVALTLTPALCAKFLKEPKKVLFWEKLASRYRAWLGVALQHPLKICALLVAVAIIGGWGLQRLPSELIPVEDEGTLNGSLDVESPATVAMRDSWYRQVEKVLEKVPERERILTGIYQDQWMWWFLTLKPNSERSRNSQAISKDLEQRFKKEIIGPNVMMNFSGLQGDGGLKIVVQYSGEYDTLVKAVQNIVWAANKMPDYFSSARSEQGWEKPRLKVIVDRPLAAEMGIGTDAIADTLSTFLSGIKAADFNFQGLDYDVQVRAPSELRSEFNHINAFFVANKVGDWVPLGSLVTLKEVSEPVQIKHYDRMRGASVTMSLKPGVALNQAIDAIIPVVKENMPPNARYHFDGKAEKYQESRNAMYLTFGLAMAFIYLVLAALFESFVLPFVVLLTVPLSVAGAVWAINFMGGTNNVYTIIGLVTLIGLITKHGILIVDFANRLRLENHSLKEAILQASEFRLRPVLMTTFAMVCGAIPLLFSVGTGAIAREHIALVIIGGMILGTVFSLFVVPVVYGLVAKKAVILPE